MPRWYGAGVKRTHRGAVAMLVVASAFSSCKSMEEPPPSPPPAEDAASPGSGATCAGWHGLDKSQHTVVVGSVLEMEVGAPESSLVAACLWAISDQIADHVGALCDAGRPYGEASKVAFTTAEAFCRDKAQSL